MNEFQQIIYDKIRAWTEFAIGLGSVQVSPHYYYAWLLREKAAPEAEIKQALREMVDAGLITARAVKYSHPSPEIAYNTGSANETAAVILALSDVEIEKIKSKQCKRTTTCAKEKSDSSRASKH